MLQCRGFGGEEKAHLPRKWSPSTGRHPQCQGRACSSMPHFFTCSEQPTWSYLRPQNTSGATLSTSKHLTKCD